MIEDQFFVRLLYNQLFGREPDEKGYNKHITWLKSTQNSEKYHRLFQSFLKSQEFQSKLKTLHLWNPSITNTEKSPYTPLEINYTVSLGSFCHASMALKRNNLKFFSSPFDWIFCNTKIIKHCLEDDFKQFLLLDNLQEIPIEQRSEPNVNLCTNKYYEKEFGIKALFNHRNPLIQEDYNYYLRCTSRFKKVLHAREGKLFFITERIKNKEKNIEDLLELDTYLKGITNNYYLLIVRFHEYSEVDIVPTSIVIRKKTDTMLIVDMYPTSPSLGSVFKNDIDNAMLDLLLRSFNYNLINL
jgi:hypothetical protein